VEGAASGPTTAIQNLGPGGIQATQESWFANITRPEQTLGRRECIAGFEPTDVNGGLLRDDVGVVRTTPSGPFNIAGYDLYKQQMDLSLIGL
jgi:hypothetical protein